MAYWNTPFRDFAGVATMEIWAYDGGAARVARVSGPEPRFMVSTRSEGGAETVVANDLRSLRRAFEIAENHLGNPSDSNVEVVIAAAERDGLASLAPATHVSPGARDRLAKLRATHKQQDQDDVRPGNPFSETERQENMLSIFGNKKVVHNKTEVPIGGGFTMTIEDAEKKGGNKSKAKKAPKASANGTPAKAKKTKAPKEAKEKKLSLIAAAAQVLAKSKDPMNCKAMLEAVEAAGLWNRGEGKTPEATLSAAIGTEISKKGKDARFEKVSPGHYVATGK